MEFRVKLVEKRKIRFVFLTIAYVSNYRRLSDLALRPTNVRTLLVCRTFVGRVLLMIMRLIGVSDLSPTKEKKTIRAGKTKKPNR